MWSDISKGVRGIVPTPRVAHGFAAVNGKLYSHGGFNSGMIHGICPHSHDLIECFCAVGILDELLMLDPRTLHWTQVTNSSHGKAPSPRFGHGFCAAGGRLYVHGGQSTTGELHPKNSVAAL